MNCFMNCFMKKCAFTFIPLLCAALIGLASPAAMSDEQSDRARLEKIKQAITRLQAELKQTKSSRDDLLNSLEESEKAAGQLSEKAEQLKTQLQQRQQKLEQMRGQRSDLSAKKQQQEQQVGQHISAAYRLGQQGGMRLLLNQQDPTTVSRNLKYYDYLIRARADKIGEYRTTIDTINRLEKDIAYQTEQLIRERDALTEKQKQLSAVQAKRKQTLAKLNTDLQGKGAELDALNGDRQRLEQVLSQVTAWLEDIDVPQSDNAFADLRGKLPWPTKGRVLRNYGSSRVSGKMAWQGMLIASATGSPVVAVHHGRVVFSDYLRGHGLLIIVDHGGNYMSLYAHNQALYKELGEWVDAGEVIASVGNTGGQQQSALYFELRYRGEPTNPKRWLRPA